MFSLFSCFPTFLKFGFLVECKYYYWGIWFPWICHHIAFRNVVIFPFSFFLHAVVRRMIIETNQKDVECLLVSKKKVLYFSFPCIYLYTVSIFPVLALYVFKNDSEPVSERFFRRLMLRSRGRLDTDRMNSAVLWMTPDSRRLYLHKSRTKKTTTRTTTSSTASAKMKIVNGIESSKKEREIILG